MNTRALSICLLCCLILLSAQNKISFADEKSHYQVATKFVELTFNKQGYHDNAMKYALLAIKDKYESDPKTKPYSNIIITAILEVIDAYINDTDTQEKVKEISSQIYMQEFTETELREMMKFYRNKVGQKALLKLPVIMQRQWEMESNLTMPSKYEQMIIDKIHALQQQGKLPEEFK